MSEETKIDELDLIEDVSEIELQDEDLVEDVEVDTEEVVVDDALVLDEATDGEDDDAGKKASASMKQAAQPTTKSGLIQAMYKEMSKMNKSDLVAAYESMMGDEDEAEDEEDEAEDDVVETKGKVKESYDFKSDLDALVSSDESLAEGFQEKAATIFEAAVKTKVADEIDRLEEEYKVSLEEETASIESSLVEKVDGYLNYVVEGWMEDNKVAVEAGLRTEIAESFMESLKNVFAEHYIDVPESKVDLVDSLAEEVKELEASVNDMTNDNIRLNEQVQAFQRSEIIAKASKDLADTEIAKLSELTEDVDFEDAETFAKKVATLKESYFAKPVVQESTEVEGATTEEEEIQLSSVMSAYASAISRTVKK